MMRRLVFKWVWWRHGHVPRVKPPIGWSEFRPVSLAYKARYWCKRVVWLAERRLYDWAYEPEHKTLHCGTMRGDGWLILNDGRRWMLLFVEDDDLALSIHCNDVDAVINHRARTLTITHEGNMLTGPLLCYTSKERAINGIPS